jgi:ABC-type branched-subunit amino acid transport system ATPase component/MFS family permease
VAERPSTVTAPDSASEAVAHLETTERDLRDDARALIGATGTSEGLPPMRALVHRSEGRWYPLAALALFLGLDEASGFVVNAVGPEASRSLGLSTSAFASIAAQRQSFVGLFAFVFAYQLWHRGSRAGLAKVVASLYGPALALGSLVTWTPALAFVVSPVGSGGAAAYSAHRPLLFDLYPPEGRVRALTLYQGGAVVGAILAPGLVAGLSGFGNLTWRGTMLGCGVLFFLLSILGWRLREPGYGRFDTDRLATLVRDAEATDEPGRTGDPTELRFGEMLRRIWRIPSVPRILVAWAVLGAALTPLLTYQAFFVVETFDLSLGERSAFSAGAWAFAIPALIWFGRRGDLAYRNRPSELVRLTAKLLVLLAAGLFVAVIPVLPVSLIGFGIVFAASAVATATLSASLLSIVRPRARPAAGALSALFFAFIGAEAGALLLGGIDRRWTTSGAIIVLALPALLAAWGLYRGSGGLDDDLDRMIDEVIEDEEVVALTSSGSHFPVLVCRGINFSYGQLQVLFDVDFTVDEGEMVALLGTNGAGKSTLLKVISGICVPSSGSVRYHGADITHLDAERRVSTGITQIPGGRAVFGSMTVADNLKGLGYLLGRDRRRLDAGIQRCYDAFPILHERRHQPASTLSGGEQQMLALSKALILRPNMLLIDELSLGLAPMIVAQLLEMVREINAEGTAVVLVEQSVSLALSLVDHAYFMEKGEIRFDGRAADLLAREDLLRAVFLEGADTYDAT